MSGLLNKADYITMALSNQDDEAVASVLNRNGQANWTVCPECRVDDFTHVQGCTINSELSDKFNEKFM